MPRQSLTSAKKSCPEKGTRNKITLETLMESFLLEQSCRNNSSRTIGFYKENITRFLSFCASLELIYPSQLTKETIQMYIQYLRNKKKWSGQNQEADEGISSKSLQTYIRAIKVWFVWLHEEGYITDDTLTHIRLPRAKRALIEIISDDEFRRITEYLHEKKQNKIRDQLLISILYETGLRLNEALTMKMSSINLASNNIKVTGKGDKERIVLFGANVARQLNRYLTLERPEPVGKTDTLFLLTDGRSLTKSAVNRLFRTMQSKLNMPKLHAHLFRHTFCTKYLAYGGDIFTLKMLTGHSSFEILNMYLHLAKNIENIQSSISILDNLQLNLKSNKGKPNKK